MLCLPPDRLPRKIAAVYNDTPVAEAGPSLSAGMVWVGVSGAAMPSSSSWQAGFTLALQRAGGR